jgi:hypothetical protein
VDNQTLGIDPAPEHGKVLCVFYRYRGERHAAIVRETEQLVIPSLLLGLPDSRET